MVARAGRQLDKAHVLQGAAHRRFANAHAIVLTEPDNQILDPPADHPQRTTSRSAGIGPSSTIRAKAARWVNRQFGGQHREVCGQSSLQGPGVEAQNPIADHLKRDPADPGRLKALAALIDRRKGQLRPRLIGIDRPLGKTPQRPGIKFPAKLNPATHGKRPVCHRES